MTAHVAILDQTGRIIAVNRAWREFAAANPPSPPDAWVGANYLAVCDAATGRGVGDARAFAAGIRAVMRGEQEVFEREYDCHAPDQRRWFRGSVSRFRGPGPLRIVVVHENITARQEAQLQLQENQRRLRELAAEMSRVEERERRRIAADLHDRIGQNLVVARLHLEELQAFAPPEPAATALGRTHALIDQTLQDVETLTFELCPRILYDLGLEAGLAEFAAECRRQHGLRVEFTSAGPAPPLSDDRRGVVFRMARELLLNVVKHARAATARLHLAWEPEQLVLTVADGGVGFAAGPVLTGRGRGRHFGLFSIRERLQSLGGRMELASQPGAGTTVTLFIPLAEPAAEAPPEDSP